jgi:arabinose-5-phosphate isomerase
METRHSRSLDSQKKPDNEKAKRLKARADFIEMGRSVLQKEIEALGRGQSRLDESFEKSVQLMIDTVQRGGRVILTGVGKSGHIAAKIAATLSSVGAPSFFVHPTEGVHGDLGGITSSDLVLAISYSGKTSEILSLLPSIRGFGVPLISLVGDLNSPLAKGSKLCIDVSVDKEACPNNLAPTSSTTLALAMGDALAMATQEGLGFSSQDFARLHPSGALGRRLTLRVRDLMAVGEDLPYCHPLDDFETFWTVLNDKRMGAVIVCEGGVCQGIITDGDIRKFLSFREKLFSKKAKELMTKDPVTIREDTMAIDAMNLMENRKSPIKEMPVVDGDQKCVGLIRLHDLVRAGL